MERKECSKTMIKLQTENGEIRISNDVFTNLAGDAAITCKQVSRVPEAQ